MTRMLRSSLVLAFVVVGIGCGGGSASTDENAAPSLELSSREPAAHIVCSHEDPCPKGTICVRGIRCAVVCNANSDCPTGQTCSGNLGGKKFCAP